MIFHPPILALLGASGLAAVVLVVAALFALKLIGRWDLASGSEGQIGLERTTYLVSTVVAFVLVVEAVTLVLFAFNADRMAALFVGAMCAVGTLNVNPWGFPALIAQMTVFFLAAAWLAIDHVDVRASDYPLARVKYGALLALLPALAAVLALQLAYFLNLKADVITSCCGSMFSENTKGLGGDLAALPPIPAMTVFYASLGAAVALAAWHGMTKRAGTLVAIASIVAFAAALAGILSFVSLYVYEHPHHHCPFCLLKPEYDWRGYWLYVPLFVAAAAGIGVGALQPFRNVASLRDVVPRVSARLATIAGIGFALFAAIATWMILRSNLILLAG